MKQLARGMMMVGLLASTAGCFEHTYNLGAGAPAGSVVYDEWQSQWLGGLIGERTMEVAQFCPSGNATIHDEQSFLNGLVAGLTAGIYTPTTVTIRCDRGGSMGLTLDENEVTTILTNPAFLEGVRHFLPEQYDRAAEGVRALDQDFDR